MGWTYTYRPKGSSHADWFQQHVMGDSYKITDSHQSGRSHVFLRVRNLEKQYDFIAVMLIRWNPRDRDGFNFGYKDMDESCGPYVHDCPLRMLEGLPEPCNEWAKEWRERVRAYHAKFKAVGKIRPGMIVQFAEPLQFTSGYTTSTLVYAGKNCFHRVGDPGGKWYGRYKPFRWRQQDFAIQQDVASVFD